MTDRSAAADEVDQTSPPAGFGSLGAILGSLVALWAAVIASFPLNDNSFFTHLATGRLILDRGSVPGTDPYTYTAAGADWTVQSWLPSVLYAGAERMGGGIGVRAVVLAVVVTAALLVWRLTRPAISVIPRVLIASGALLVGTGLWGERPYMVGVIGLAIVWLALDGAVAPLALVPLFWVWANSHGSFPLAWALILLVLAGTALDRRADRIRPWRDELSTELRVLSMTALGTALAVVGPLGFGALTFPLKAVTQSRLLSEILEWQPPQYRSLSERAFLVLVAATFLALARRGTWRLVLPAVAFSVAGMYAQRNVVMAVVVLVPVLATTIGPVGSLRSDDRPALGAPVTAVLGAVVALVAFAAITSPVASFGGYPDRALAWLGPVDDDTRGLMHGIPTGNLLEVLDGDARRAVFIDDRADMFPVEVFEDHLVLLRGEPGWDVLLDDRDVDVVVWERERPLASLLTASDAWQTVYADTGWVVACRRDGGCG